MRVGIPYTDCEYESEVPCTREDEALAFASGVILGGGECGVFMQNSGLGHCVDIITSLLLPYDIQICLLIKNRQEPEHHAFMGRITNDLLRLLGYKIRNSKDNGKSNK